MSIERLVYECLWQLYLQYLKTRKLEHFGDYLFILVKVYGYVHTHAQSKDFANRAAINGISVTRKIIPFITCRDLQNILC